MLKAVEEAHAGLADIEAGRAEPGKDKRAKGKKGEGGSYLTSRNISTAT